MVFIWKFFGTNFMHALVFTLVPVFVIAVGSGRGDGAANFAELDSDFSEPGKHVWTSDMTDVLHVCLNGLCMACEHRWVLRCNVRQPTVCSEVTVISDERWPSHVVTWKAVRWYCGSMPALRCPINSNVNMDWVTLSSFPFRAATCFLPECGLGSW